MRLRGLVGLGALVVVAACSDAVGPPAEGRDLDFVAPPEDLASVVADPTSGLLPLISRKYVSGSWKGNEYKLLYGMFGGGTGYTMMPQVRIFDPDGSVALTQSGPPKSEDLPLYWYMRPTDSLPLTVPFYCGAFADATVNFEVRMSVYGLTPTLLRTQQNESATTWQGMCWPTEPPTGGGSGSGGGHYTITVCQYEAWYTPDGTVIAIVELGCVTVEGSQLAE